jgi:NADH dehydrogenase [ubiquinone] 1 alpha subcomplex assembly factor 7
MPEPSDPLIRFDHFMARANAAYYARHDPFADFTTAPEISQVFGELLGLWAGLAWTALGSPEQPILAEAGPGRGTLMADALRALRRTMPDFAAQLAVHFIETSPRLRALQEAVVPGATWHDAIDDLPDRPVILLANEFLDALPVRQFVCRAGTWRERHVDGSAYVERDADIDLAAAAEGSVREVNEAALSIAAHLARRGALALFVDYGATSGAPGETVQALRHGRPADPLAAPGEADITAHVDFAALAAAGRDAGARIFGPVAQAEFLTALGLWQRTSQLARGKDAATGARLTTAAHRLTAPEAMGKLFQVLAIAPRTVTSLPGFAS